MDGLKDDPFKRFGRWMKTVNRKRVVYLIIGLISLIWIIGLILFIQGYVFNNNFPEYFLIMLPYTFALIFLLLSLSFIVLFVKEGLSAVKKTGIVSPIIFIIVYILALPAYLYFLNKIQHESLIQHTGTPVLADVIAKKADENSETGDSYFVTYRFYMSHHMISQRTQVNQREWQRMTVGGKLTVKYLPDNPEHNLPEGYYSSWNGYNTTLLLNTFFSLVLVCSLWEAFIKKTDVCKKAIRNNDKNGGN